MKKKVCISCGECLHHDEWWGKCDYGLIHAECFDEEQKENPDYKGVKYVTKHHPKRRLYHFWKKITYTKKKRYCVQGEETYRIINNLIFIADLHATEAQKAIEKGEIQEARAEVSAMNVAIKRYGDMIKKMWKEVVK